MYFPQRKTKAKIHYFLLFGYLCFNLKKGDRSCCKKKKEMTITEQNLETDKIPHSYGKDAEGQPLLLQKCEFSVIQSRDQLNSPKVYGMEVLISSSLCIFPTCLGILSLKISALS